MKWNDLSIKTTDIVPQLRQQRKFQCLGAALHQGKAAQLWAAEAEVVLYKPAKKNVNGNRHTLPGPPLTLRLIVVQLRRANGQVLAEWLLLTNAPQSLATPQKLAHCYYLLLALAD